MKFLTDEDLRGQITEGILARLPELDLVRVQDVGLRSANDALVLEFAASENRILISQDVRTMIVHAKARLLAGKPMPGLLLIPDSIPIGIAIESVITVAECSLEGEWDGKIQYLPL
ncbi:MAG: DUF5615 family PIN-like protein [Acidobacteria bacterium]|nr:DUF5615 family PIN-like protein [Acidobacteriota bacterium]